MAFKLSKIYRVKEQDFVMVECNQSSDFLLIDLACNLIGAVFVPFEVEASLVKIKDIFEQTKAHMIICCREELNFAQITSYDELFKKTDYETLNFETNSNSIAEILYTTGSTGRSKGIKISNSANISLAENIMFGVKMKAGNTELIPLPLSHSHALRCCYANLLNGGTIILTNGVLKMDKLFSCFEKYRVTAIDLSPSAAAVLVKLSHGKFGEYAKKLDYVQVGTALLPDQLKTQLIENLPGVHLFNFYGSTESGRSCVLDFSVDTHKKFCIGKPTINSEIIFTDEHRKPIQTSPNHLGLLASKGTMNMDGYLNDPVSTEKVMNSGYLYTNDAGYKDEKGYIYVVGRKDDVINFNGIKISPVEIEEVAAAYPGIKDAACVPLANQIAGQIPKLYISVEKSSTLDMQGYKIYLHTHLDSNKVPQMIEIIDEIPRAFNGKLQRNKLLQK